MPTLDWLHRAPSFPTAAQVPYRLLDTVSTQGDPQHATTPFPDAPLVVYGEANRLGDARLALARVTFKHIPYDVKAR